MEYNREKAVLYAHKWAYSYNPRYYKFSGLGGDCTNFVSQALFAGSGIMNYTPVYGWYFISLNNRAPAWTGVNELYRFLVNNKGAGPQAVETELSEVAEGDVIQINFGNTQIYNHTAIVVNKGRGTPETVLVAAHSYPSDYRPVSTYPYKQLRCIHITGVGIPEV
ncbi:MAG: amidase domain-containing protein [Clostridia bacterium]|nr:amidase domain-containing protein [Clostridia bacterium]